jgi:hypothetical protein
MGARGTLICRGPDQDPKPLVSVPILPLLLFGVDWGTLPLSYRRSKKGKR